VVDPGQDGAAHVHVVERSDRRVQRDVVQAARRQQRDLAARTLHRPGDDLGGDGELAGGARRRLPGRGGAA
jgi:hypothetical protein